MKRKLNFKLEGYAGSMEVIWDDEPNTRLESDGAFLDLKGKHEIALREAGTEINARHFEKAKRILEEAGFTVTIEEV